MGVFRKSALAGAFAAVSAMPAFAADLAESYVEVAPVPYELSSNWYLRGDIGYKWYSAPSARFDLPGYGNMIGESLESTGLAGVGFGYQWNPSFRMDVTVDYEWPSEFHGRLRCPNPCTGDPDPEYSDEYANISAWTGLVNFYWDIPMSGEGVGAFTPYIGAGIGASHLKTTDVHFRNPNGTTGSWNGASTWNLAWSVTAGTSYAITNNWLVDINYRYLNLGDAVSGKTLSSFNNKRIEYNNIDAHELRVGLRYLIN